MISATAHEIHWSTAGGAAWSYPEPDAQCHGPPSAPGTRLVPTIVRIRLRTCPAEPGLPGCTAEVCNWAKKTAT
jgi:hypothetical protein